MNLAQIVEDAVLDERRACLEEIKDDLDGCSPEYRDGLVVACRTLMERLAKSLTSESTVMQAVKPMSATPFSPLEEADLRSSLRAAHGYITIEGATCARLFATLDEARRLHAKIDLDGAELSDARAQLADARADLDGGHAVIAEITGKHEGLSLARLIREMVAGLTKPPLMVVGPNGPRPIPEPSPAVMKQQAPLLNNSPEVWPVVMQAVHASGLQLHPKLIADMYDREAMGRAKYGTVLRRDNGRDAAVDAYQEALDLLVYLTQCAMRAESKTRPGVPLAVDHESRGFLRLVNDLCAQVHGDPPVIR